MKRLDAVLVVCLMTSLPFVMGASIEQTQAVGNPNGKLLTIHQAGEYKLAAGEQFVYIHACAKRNMQENPVTSDVNPVFETWSKTRSVPAAGTYSCFGRIYYVPAGGGATKHKDSDSTNVTVN